VTVEFESIGGCSLGGSLDSGAIHAHIHTLFLPPPNPSLSLTHTYIHTPPGIEQAPFRARPRADLAPQQQRPQRHEHHPGTYPCPPPINTNPAMDTHTHTHTHTCMHTYVHTHTYSRPPTTSPQSINTHQPTSTGPASNAAAGQARSCGRWAGGGAPCCPFYSCSCCCCPCWWWWCCCCWLHERGDTDGSSGSSREEDGRGREG
jgi:hypothetical protein